MKAPKQELKTTKGIITPEVKKNDGEELEKWQIDMISMLQYHEGVRLVAYCDKLLTLPEDENGYVAYIKNCPTGKERHSIGYGTTSYKGETIKDKAEAVRRMTVYLKRRVYPLVENTTCYTENQKTAIGDFMYNAGEGKRILKENSKTEFDETTFLEYVNACNYKAIERFIAPYNYEQKGLKKRRQSQYNFWKGIEKF